MVSIQKASTESSRGPIRGQGSSPGLRRSESMFGPKISIDKELYKRAKAHALSQGYSSLSEMVAHLLEKEMASPEQDDESALEDRLKGLGYL